MSIYTEAQASFTRLRARQSAQARQTQYELALADADRQRQTRDFDFKLGETDRTYLSPYLERNLNYGGYVDTADARYRQSVLNGRSDIEDQYTRANNAALFGQAQSNAAIDLDRLLLQAALTGQLNDASIAKIYQGGA